MPKFGETREDGRRFVQRYSRNGKTTELWLPEESFQKRVQDLKARRQATMDRYRSDPEYREAYTKNRKAWSDADYRRNMLARVRARRKDGVESNIQSIEDIPYSTHCPVFNVPFDQSSTWFRASLDRIDPKGGYTKGNVIVVSMLANAIKSHATPDQILAVGRFYKALEKKMRKI